VAKLAPRELAQVLSRLPKQPANADVLVGYDTADDAGVFRLRDDVALVQTVDFFTPIADDPEVYGAIAAINSLNDVYAMGGVPISSLAIVCFPRKGDLEMLSLILKGGQQAMNEAGVNVLGGHTVDDAEIKFGYAVTGTVHPQRIITNAGAQPGDVLVLTKPIGTGAITTGIKRGVVAPEIAEFAMRCMMQSAREASNLMQTLRASACTDVTGFGLLGHAYEMAKGSRVTLKINAADVPLLPATLDLIRQGMLTRGDVNNREYVGDEVSFGENVSSEMQSALFDPQTAGGLLISLKADAAARFTNEIESSVIGEVSRFEGKLLKIS
jgi:selenide,water dikinase